MLCSYSPHLDGSPVMVARQHEPRDVAAALLIEEPLKGVPAGRVGVRVGQIASRKAQKWPKTPQKWRNTA